LPSLSWKRSPSEDSPSTRRGRTVATAPRKKPTPRLRAYAWRVARIPIFSGLRHRPRVKRVGRLHAAAAAVSPSARNPAPKFIWKQTHHDACLKLFFFGARVGLYRDRHAHLRASALNCILGDGRQRLEVTRPWSRPVRFLIGTPGVKNQNSRGSPGHCE